VLSILTALLARPAPGGGHELIFSSRSRPCGSSSAYSGARRSGLAYAAQTASCRVWLSRHWPRWKSALVIVKPDTVLRWHRDGYRRYWRWRSKGKPGRPRIPRRHIAFIRRISSENPRWGEDRIALEMKLKLGVDHSTSTIRRYMVDGGPPTGSTWRRFLASHAREILAIDFATQPLWDFSVHYVLVVLALDTRRVVHCAVTASPTLAWVKQQLREATAWGNTPRFLLHDNDGIFGQYRCRAAAEGGGRTYRCALDRQGLRQPGVLRPARNGPALPRPQPGHQHAAIDA